MKHYLGFDDALDAFGVHAIGGIIGGIATAFFATDQVGAPFGFGDNVGKPILGVYYGGLRVGGHQLAVQLVGISFSIGWSFIWSYILLQIIDKTIGLRVTVHDEELGLDSSIHGEHIGALKANLDFEKDLAVGIVGETLHGETVDNQLKLDSIA